MRQSICLFKILHNKWAYMVCGVFLVIFAMYCYECISFDLDQGIDLPAYAAEVCGKEAFDVVNRVDAQGVTLFLVEDGMLDYLVVAYPRSLLFNRYDSKFETFSVPKNSGKVFLCQFDFGILSHGFQLGDDFAKGFAPSSYFFDLSIESNTLKYSVINSDGVQGAVLFKQLIPYLFIVCIIFISLSFILKKANIAKNNGQEQGIKG